MVKSPLLIQRGCIYNQRVMLPLPWDSFITLMIFLLPMAFQLTWLFIFHVCSLDFHFTIHFEYHLHDPQWGSSIWKLMTWHAIRLLTWAAWWCDKVKPIMLLCAKCLLENSLLFTSVWLGDKESSMILSLELQSQIDVPFLSCDWSTYMFNYKSVFQHVPSFIHSFIISP